MQAEFIERKKAEERLKYLNLHDPLTGLYNRAYFEEELCRLESAAASRVGIILCDIDGLKLVNDTVGHEHGDKLLITSANLLKACLAARGRLFHIDGDEFAILFENTPLSELEAGCSCIYKAVKRFNSENTAIPLSLAVGMAYYDGAICSMSTLFKEAANNMHRKKLHHRQSARSALVHALIKALEARDMTIDKHADRWRL